MGPLKLRLLNQYGLPARLASPDDVKVYFPYESSDALVKSMKSGHVKILNDERGEIEVELSQFEVNGMPIGIAQNFTVDILNGSKIRHGVFERAFNVRTMMVDGTPRKVIEKR
jgi:hypothetical protein